MWLIWSCVVSESSSVGVASTQSTHSRAFSGSMASASWSVGASSCPATPSRYSHALIIRASVEAGLRRAPEPDRSVKRSVPCRMAVEAPEITAEQLREQTLDWLRENLPPGWMEAVDNGDDE